VTISRSKSVTAMAITIPMPEMRLPFRAVFALDSHFRPMMNSDAERR
jgi:hypothetical protein